MISERHFEDDGRLIVHRIADLSGAVESVRDAREATQAPMSDSWHVARVPMFLVTVWLKDAGLRWDDPAAKDLMKRKLQSGEFAAFRVKQGTW